MAEYCQFFMTQSNTIYKFLNYSACVFHVLPESKPIDEDLVFFTIIFLVTSMYIVPGRYQALNIQVNNARALQKSSLVAPEYT